MKKILILIIITLITSCGATPEEVKEMVKQRDTMLILNKEFNTTSTSVFEYWFDGCQYIKVDCCNSTWGTHKGNCKNPIHIYNKVY